MQAGNAASMRGGRAARRHPPGGDALAVRDRLRHRWAVTDPSRPPTAPPGTPRGGWLDRRGGAIVLLVAVLAVALVAGWLRFFAPRSAPKGVTMTDLEGVEDLKARFNADRGTTRLVVIFSPT
jgi:hypothetical protein